MLRAILGSKAGRINIDGEIEHSWRDLFRLREDLLTAVFFSRVRYLSESGERSVLDLLCPPTLPSRFGALKEISFWPKLAGQKGRHFVEPDVILECENALVVVEVKPPFGGEQSLTQWRDEVTSLVIQKDRDDSEWVVPDTICLLALGRNRSDWREAAASLEQEFEDEGLIVHCMEWSQISEAIAKLASEEKGRDSAVYEDWKAAFSLFGLVETPKPFSDLVGHWTFSPFPQPYWKADWSGQQPTGKRNETTPSVDWQTLEQYSRQLTLRNRPWP